jgi:D-cysteine desulfhydrase
MTADLPILRRFPALAALPRAPLGSFPTPIDRVRLENGRALLVKRDDRSGASIGGNKVRGLEWLLGSVRAGDRVLTVGPTGSTHALSTAMCARQLGADTTVVTWTQELNAAALRVASRMRKEATIVDAKWVGAAYVAAALHRLTSRVRWIPAGGAHPVAILGHVNAALELADQIVGSRTLRPDSIFVPLGTGGTAAGLALGLRIAGIDTRVVAVRVVPRIVGRARRVAALANATARMIEHLTGEPMPRLSPSDLHVEHAYFGGGYGRALPTVSGEAALAEAGVRLDGTYSQKCFAAAAAARAERPMLWLTFDGRLLQD